MNASYPFASMNGSPYAQGSPGVPNSSSLTDPAPQDPNKRLMPQQPSPGPATVMQGYSGRSAGFATTNPNYQAMINNGYRGQDPWMHRSAMAPRYSGMIPSQAVNNAGGMAGASAPYQPTPGLGSPYQQPQFTPPQTQVPTPQGPGGPWGYPMYGAMYPGGGY